MSHRDLVASLAAGSTKASSILGNVLFFAWTPSLGSAASYSDCDTLVHQICSLKFHCAQ